MSRFCVSDLFFISSRSTDRFDEVLRSINLVNHID